MTKLTVSMRDQIVAKAIEKAGINKAFRDYHAERKEWACAVADESVGGADAVKALAEANKKIAAAMKSLPENLRSDLRAGPLEGAVFASFGGMRCRVNEWDGYRPARSGLMLPADHPLSVQFESLELKSKELSKRKSNLESEVRAVLESVTTVGKLLSVWPEAKELIPAQSQKASLPSVNVETLNTVIGLPSENE